MLLSATGGFAKYSGYLIGDILTIQPEELILLAVLLCLTVVLLDFLFQQISACKFKPGSGRQ